MPRAIQNVTNDPCNTETVSTVNTSSEPLPSPSKGFAWNLIITGVIGWIAAFTLTLERLHVAADPNATLSCDLNPFISCKSVMLTVQAKLFGFPNPLIGLAAFVAPIVVGFAILAGAKFAPWFWRVFTAGVTAGFIFVLWLFAQSTFVIGVLCPYCMLAWAAMLPMFWRVILFGANEGIVETPLRFVGFFDRVANKAWVFTLVTEAIIVAIIIARFWSNWPSLF
jgi:uncharacterized membrane protein